MKKFVFNENFEPFSCNEGDELFQNGIFVFNITKLLAFINNNSESFKIENVSINNIRNFVPKNLDELTIQNADISSPIILAEIAPHQFNIIDGNHRVEKAYREELNTIFSYRIPSEQLLAFLTSKEAYKTYIHYWNSKIDEANSLN